MLKYLYENQPKCDNFVPRKLLLDENKTLLFGSPLSGKTKLGLNWLKNYTNSFYLDPSDLRYSLNFLELSEFIKQNNIKALCLDNITKIPEILPNCERILLISNDKSLEFSGFIKKNLFGLDFEEFIAFSKNSDESTLFSQFMSCGNSLPIYKDESFLRYAILSRTSDLAQKILSSNALYENENFNALSVFRELKESRKISKDSFYNELFFLENSGIIAFAKNYSENSRIKRLYFCDFSLRRLFTLSKNPRKIIENMVFCELAKSGEQVYFKGEFDFYLPRSKTGILVLPFLDTELAILKAKKLVNDDLSEIIIISNSEGKTSRQDKTQIKTMSFATFAAGYLE